MRRRCSLRKHALCASGNASRSTASSSNASNAAQVFAEKYERYGLASIWDDSRSAGILPCRVYLRHCVLAAEKAGQHVRDDLLDSTLLADRRCACYFFFFCSSGAPTVCFCLVFFSLCAR